MDIKYYTAWKICYTYVWCSTCFLTKFSIILVYNGWSSKIPWWASIYPQPWFLKLVDKFYPPIFIWFCCLHDFTFDPLKNMFFMLLKKKAYVYRIFKHAKNIFFLHYTKKKHMCIAWRGLKVKLHLWRISIQLNLNFNNAHVLIAITRTSYVTLIITCYSVDY